MRFRHVIAPGALLAAILLSTGVFPRIASAAVYLASARAMIVFGDRGGNMAPFQVTIFSDGSIKAAGFMHPQQPSRRLSQRTLRALLQRARTTGFFALSKLTQCPGTLPDIATRFISMRAAGSVHQAAVHGSCISIFNRLFTKLTRATALTAGSQTTPPSQATFIFGREGGNIRPYQVTISSDGTVTVNGPVTLQTPSRHVTADQLNALLQRAQSDGFFDLPAQTNCPGSLPDFASLFVEIDTSSQSHRAAVRGTCVSAFTDLYQALVAAAGVSS